MDTRDKTLPRGPQETAGPNPSINPDAIADNPGIETSAFDGDKDVAPHFIPPAGDAASLAFTDVEPAEDVGEEVGKTSFFTPERLKLIGAVAGGLAIAAGVALYVRARQKPVSRVERFAHKIGLSKLNLSKPALGYSREVDKARDRLSHYEGKARDRISHLEDLARDRLNRIHLSDLHLPSQFSSRKARNTFLSSYFH